VRWWLSNSFSRAAHTLTHYFFMHYAVNESEKNKMKISHMLNQLRSMKKCYVRKISHDEACICTLSCAKLEFRLINLILMHKLMQHTPPHSVISFESSRCTFEQAKRYFDIYLFFYSIYKTFFFAVTVFGLKLVLLYVHFRGESWVSSFSRLFISFATANCRFLGAMETEWLNKVKMQKS
jgi:hypothetical protein